MRYRPRFNRPDPITTVKYLCHRCGLVFEVALFHKAEVRLHQRCPRGHSWKHTRLLDEVEGSEE